MKFVKFLIYTVCALGLTTGIGLIRASFVYHFPVVINIVCFIFGLLLVITYLIVIKKVKDAKDERI